MSERFKVFAFASVPELRLLKEFEEGLGRRVADMLRAQGADQILAALSK